jgi:hypothetical protein
LFGDKNLSDIKMHGAIKKSSTLSFGLIPRRLNSDAGESPQKKEYDNNIIILSEG